MSVSAKKLISSLSNTSIMALVLAVALFAIMMIIRPGDFTFAALGTAVAAVLANAAMLLFASAGQMVVITSGGIDLSTGAIMSTTACLTVEIMNGNNDMLLPAILVCLVFGFFVGTLNGIGVACIKIPALILTLCMSNVLTKFQPIFTGAYPRGTVSQQLADAFSWRFMGFVPGIFLCSILFYILLVLFLTRLQYGSRLNMVGTNPTASVLSGIRAKRVTMLAYSFGGLIAGLGGFVGAGYFRQLQIATFDGYTMQSIAAVVIGGSMIAGGKSSYFGTLTGTVMLMTLSLFLSTINTDIPIRNIIMGAMLISLLIIYNRKPGIRQ
jgi:ribose transport system permease protein